MDLLDVKRQTVHKWIKDEKIKAVRIGRQLRITKEYYDEFMTKNTIDNTN